jgi:hypothetical protein
VSFINSRNKYEYLSNTILLVFFLLLGGAALLTDIFHTPVKTSIEASGMATLYKAKELDFVTKISLKNKSGSYVFEKIEKNQISPWHMTSPRSVTANSIFIEKLFNSLITIKIKNIFPNDKINNSNFSLEKPNASVVLEGASAGTAINIDVGLLNTIDNTTYLKVSTKNSIYQVEVPSVSLENATILDLIESKIFSIDLESINSFKVSFHNKSSSEINIHKKATAWVNNAEISLAQDKVDEYFQDLSTIKSSFVLDSQTDQQKKQISSLSRNPEITLTAKDNKGNIITYKISPLIYNFPDLDFKGAPYFLVSISNNQTAYIVKKEFLDLFSRKF